MSGRSRSAVQSRFYDEARRRGGVPAKQRGVERPPPATSGLPLIFRRYLTRLNAKGCTSEHIAKTERALREFASHISRLGIDPLDVPYDISQEYINALLRRKAVTTVAKTDVTAIKGAYQFAIELRDVVVNPMRLVVVPGIPDQVPLIYSAADLRAMLAAASGLEDLILHVFVYTGMRRSEVLRLRFDKIDWGENQIEVLGKGHPAKLRFVPIHPALRMMLLSADANKRDGQLYAIESNRRQAMGHDRLTQILTRLAARAGVEWRGTKTFRKTVASNLYAEGVRESYIEAILGHAPRTVNARHYRHIADERLQDAILHLYRSDPLEWRPRSSQRPGVAARR